MERGAFLSFIVIMHNIIHNTHMKDLNAYLQNLNEPGLGTHYLTSKNVFAENTISSPAVEPHRHFPYSPTKESLLNGVSVQKFQNFSDLINKSPSNLFDTTIPRMKTTPNLYFFCFFLLVIVINFGAQKEDIYDY